MIFNVNFKVKNMNTIHALIIKYWVEYNDYVPFNSSVNITLSAVNTFLNSNIISQLCIMKLSAYLQVSFESWG